MMESIWPDTKDIMGVTQWIIGRANRILKWK
jgi:hypothetical protein